MHRKGHKTRKVSRATRRRLRYSQRRNRRRLARATRAMRRTPRQRGGMPASVMSPEGIPVALEGTDTYTTVFGKVGGVSTAMSYDTYKEYKENPEAFRED